MFHVKHILRNAKFFSVQRRFRLLGNRSRPDEVPYLEHPCRCSRVGRLAPYAEHLRPHCIDMLNGSIRAHRSLVNLQQAPTVSRLVYIIGRLAGRHVRVWAAELLARTAYVRNFTPAILNDGGHGASSPILARRPAVLRSPQA